MYALFRRRPRFAGGGFPYRKERMMKPYAPGAWISLNTSYYAAPICDQANLLDDASLLLGSVRGIAQSLSDLLSEDADSHPADLADAL